MNALKVKEMRLSLRMGVFCDDKLVMRHYEMPNDQDCKENEDVWVWMGLSLCTKVRRSEK